MSISFDRSKHSLCVAKKMKEIVCDNRSLFACSPNDAFLLGLIHDIGYELSSDQEQHAHNGGLFLREQGYKYWKEVYYHGFYQFEYSSSLLELLNYADLITSPSGKLITIDERISNIASRYGIDSFQYKEAIKLSKLIKTVNYK